MTANQLQKAEARWRADFARAEKSREARNRLVFEARAAGWTDQRIGEAMGLTRGRINQIKGP